MWDRPEMEEHDRQLVLQILIQQQQLMADLNEQASAFQLATQEIVSGFGRTSGDQACFGEEVNKAEETTEFQTPQSVMHAGQSKSGHSLRASGESIIPPATIVDFKLRPPSQTGDFINKMAYCKLLHNVDLPAKLQDQSSSFIILHQLTYSGQHTSAGCNATVGGFQH